MHNVYRMLFSIAVLFSLMLTACGGGGGGAGGNGSGPAVAKVEIQQAGLLLTDMGATKQLSAVAYDSQGSVLSATIHWSSTKTDISVDSSGKVTAATNNGSSQIVAEADGVKSAPLLVAVTTLPAGAIKLTDAQIVGEPFETDPNALPSFNNTYKVILTGVSAPAMGALLINTESKPVAGRVVAVDTAGGQTTVTLALASLREMFPNLSVNEVIDLSQAPVSFPDDVAADYDIQREGNTFTFTPKPTAQPAVVAAAVAPRAVGTPIGTGPLLPFTECKHSLTGVGADAPLPIGLSAPPLFSVTINPTLDMVVTPGNGLERFVIKAEPVIKVEGSVNVTAAFEGKIECTADLFILRVPVGGPLSVVISGLMPIGVGLEVGGKITVATLGLGTDVTYKAKTEFGLVCPNGANCAFARSLSGDLQKPNYKVDAPSLGDLRLEPSVAAFGYVGADIGNPFLKKLRFEAFKAKAGGKLQGSFAPQISQILDTNYKSDYKVSLEGSAGVGTELGEVVKLLGLSSVSALELAVSIDLATSPTGTVTADRTTFVTGDTINFRVAMDPAKVNFIDLYNIKKILLVRNSGGSQTLVGSLIASSGQTDFNFSFTAPGPGAVSEFFAFVDTMLPLPDVLALEVGNAVGSADDNPIIFEGDITLDTQERINAFNNSGISNVTGNLTIRLGSDAVPTPLVASLPGLRKVGGSLSIQGLLSSINLPGLVEVGFNGSAGSLSFSRVTSSQSGVTFPALTRIAGSLFVDQLTGVNSVSFPSLTRIEDSLFSSLNPTLTSVSFPVLAQMVPNHGGIFITDNSLLTNIALGPVEIVTSQGGLFITGNAVLSSLSSVSCGIRIRTSNGGVFITDNPNMPQSEAERVTNCIAANNP